MKTIIAFLVAITVRAAALDITIPGDRTYRECANVRVSGAELLFMHSTGTARIPFAKVPVTLQQKYFGAEKIAAFEAQRRTDEERKAAAAAAALATKREADRRTAEGVARQAAADLEWEEKKKARAAVEAAEKRQIAEAAAYNNKLMQEREEPKAKAAAAARATEDAENVPIDHYIATFTAAREEAKRASDVLRQHGIPPAPEVSGLSPEENAARAARMENYRARKWERFTAKMVTPTKDGQIMQTPRGMTIHVRGDLGRAKGESYAGYFERDGNYDYTSASGPERVQNYLCRGSASSDMGADSVLLGRIKLRIMKGEKIPFEVATELQVRLESEGAYVTPMSELIDFLRRR